MSSFRDPVGPLPAKTYWRRRLVVGLGFLAVLVVILLIIFRPPGEDKPAKPAPTNSSETTPSSTAKPTKTTPSTPVDPSTVKACIPSQITLTAVPDSNVYKAGQNPKLVLEITNTGVADCSLNVGTTQQAFIITSGKEMIWNSQHCDVEPQDQVISLSPNVPQRTEAVTWNRTKSSSTDCAAGEIANVPDATYNFQVKVGEITSDQVRLRILH